MIEILRNQEDRYGSGILGFRNCLAQAAADFV